MISELADKPRPDEVVATLALHPKIEAEKRSLVGVKSLIMKLHAKNKRAMKTVLIIVQSLSLLLLMAGIFCLLRHD